MEGTSRREQGPGSAEKTLEDFIQPSDVVRCEFQLDPSDPEN